MRKKIKKIRTLDLEQIITLKGEDGESRLDYLLRKPPLRGVLLEIHPDIAQIILDKKNEKNRSVSDKNVKKIAHQIQNGEWSRTGDTLKFTTEELLRDGQHRLKACVKTDTPIIVDAVFGLLPETFTKMDTGKTRGGADVLSIIGVPNPFQAAASLRHIKAIENGGVYPEPWTNEMIKEFYYECKQWLDKSYSHRKDMENAYGLKATPVSVLSFFLLRHSKKLDDNFFKAALFEAHFPRNECFRVMRRKLLSLSQNGEVKVRPELQISYLIHVFNKWNKAQPLSIQTLNWRQGKDSIPMLDFSGYVPYPEITTLKKDN